MGGETVVEGVQEPPLMLSCYYPPPSPSPPSTSSPTSLPSPSPLPSHTPSPPPFLLYPSLPSPTSMYGKVYFLLPSLQTLKNHHQQILSAPFVSNDQRLYTCIKYDQKLNL